MVHMEILHLRLPRECELQYFYVSGCHIPNIVVVTQTSHIAQLCRLRYSMTLCGFKFFATNPVSSLCGKSPFMIERMVSHSHPVPLLG